MRFFVDGMLHEQDARLRPPRTRRDASCDGIGLAERPASRNLPASPSHPAWIESRSSSAVLVDERKLIKGDRDEGLNEILEREAQQEHCRDCLRVLGPVAGIVGLWNSQARFAKAGATP